MRLALVTGANRGIGFGVSRQLAARGFQVALGSRDLDKGIEAARRLDPDGNTVFAVQLDVTDDASVASAADAIAKRFGHLDVLVNNAAIMYDTWARGVSVDLCAVHEALETNLFGAWRVTQAFLPLLRRSESARIVNVSSGARQLSDMDGQQRIWVAVAVP